tara:strand:- start:7 stop:195 length:189 start_codon:yes stop_codon:yes gene_type:complete
MFVDNKNKIIKIRDMRELKLLFSEAWKEAKSKPLEALGTLATFIVMCGTCYAWMWICYIIGG